MFVHRNALLGLGRGVLVTASGFIEMGMRCFAAIALARSFGYLGVCFANPLVWLGACVFVTLLYSRLIRQRTAIMKGC